MGQRHAFSHINSSSWSAFFFELQSSIALQPSKRGDPKESPLGIQALLYADSISQVTQTPAPPDPVVARRPDVAFG